MMTRDDVVMTKISKILKLFKIVQKRLNMISFNEVSDRLGEFYGHLREFPKIGTR